MVDSPRAGDLIGRIQSRLLVNAWVDPEQVAPLLPPGVRPHVGSSGGVIAGCCMIEVEATRPWPMPEAVGVSISAAAHRLSVEIGPVEEPTVGVYVPARSTNSFSAIAAGGRLFPGVHQSSDVTVGTTEDALSWVVKNSSESIEGFDISATATRSGSSGDRSEVADIVIGTVMGLSPARKVEQLEAVDMIPFDRSCQIVELTDLQSPFLSSFSSAKPAETLLMTNVGVIWRANRSVAKRVNAHS